MTGFVCSWVLVLLFSLSALANDDLVGQEFIDVAHPEQKIRIINRLGSGGLNTAFKAENSLGHVTTLKRLHAGSAIKFNRELETSLSKGLPKKAPIVRFLGVRILESLVSHEKIEFGEYEHVDGVSLQQLIFEDKKTALIIRPDPIEGRPVVAYAPEDLEERIDHLLSCFWDMVDGLIILANAQRGSLLHRDINPKNIIVYSDAKKRFLHAKLIDLDLLTESSLLDSGEFSGTPSYSPVDYYFDVNSGVNNLADLYSLSLTFLTAILGESPHLLFFEYLYKTDQMPEGVEVKDLRKNPIQLWHFLEQHSELWMEWVGVEISTILDTWPEKKLGRLEKKVRKMFDAIIGGVEIDSTERSKALKDWFKTIFIFDKSGALIGRKNQKGKVIFDGRSKKRRCEKLSELPAKAK